MNLHSTNLTHHHDVFVDLKGKAFYLFVFPWKINESLIIFSVFLILKAQTLFYLNLCIVHLHINDMYIFSVVS